MTALFKTPAMPKIEPPTPLPDEADTQMARRRTMAKEKQGTGATSNMLTDGGREKLGG